MPKNTHETDYQRELEEINKEISSIRDRLKEIDEYPRHMNWKDEESPKVLEKEFGNQNAAISLKNAIENMEKVFPLEIIMESLYRTTHVSGTFILNKLYLTKEEETEKTKKMKEVSRDWDDLPFNVIGAAYDILKNKKRDQLNQMIEKRNSIINNIIKINFEIIHVNEPELISLVEENSKENMEKYILTWNEDEICPKDKAYYIPINSILSDGNCFILNLRERTMAKVSDKSIDDILKERKKIIRKNLERDSNDYSFLEKYTKIKIIEPQELKIKIR